jgi:pimeloyl-ACP methyl ester carboxylesterase
MGRSFRLQIIPVLTLLVLEGCTLQTKMLYCPDTHIPSQESLVADNIQFWPSGANTYRGFVNLDPVNSSKGTVLVFHGNGGTASDRAYYVKVLTSLGYRVVLVEYPAYGGRKGRPSETVFVDDGRETLRIAFEKYGKPIYLLGESLGCGVVASIVKNTPVPIDGIILITPWDTLLSVAREKFPWLPVRLFMKDTYDSVGNLKAFSGRIAVVGAERDKVIPVHHALALYESLSGNKKMCLIKGAGHNDWSPFVGAPFWKEIMAFASRDTNGLSKAE